jgi:single-strand DNA-binding protein
MNEPTVQITGNLTADPELRFTSSGTAVANFTVAATPRRFDAAKKEYVDGDPTFLRCTVWRQQAENVAESFRRGDRVMVVGTLRTNSFEDRDTGAKRSTIECTATEVGASVLFAQASLRKATRSEGRPAAAADSGPAGDDEPPF